MVQDGIKQVVAHKGAGGVAHLRGQTRLLDGADHFFDGQGGETGRRSRFFNGLVLRLMAFVVPDVGVCKVDGHPFHRQALPAPCLAQHQHGVRLIKRHRLNDCPGGLEEDRRHTLSRSPLSQVRPAAGPSPPAPG